MTIDGKVIYEKLQYDIKREAAKISALSFGKIDRYEYLTGKEKLSSDQRRAMDKNKTKTIADQGKKETDALEEHEKQLI